MRIALGVISATLVLPALALVGSGLAANEFISPWLSLGNRIGVELETDAQSAAQMAVAALMYAALVVSFAGSAVTGVICAVTKKAHVALYALVAVGVVVLGVVLVMFAPQVPSQYLSLLLIPVFLCIVPLILVAILAFLSARPNT